MRYHLTLVRMTTIKKSTNNKWWRGCREIEPLTLLVRVQTGTVTMENTVEILLKSRNRTAIQPSNPTCVHTH